MALTQTQTQVVSWLATGKTGASSEAIAFHLGLGLPRKQSGRSHPLDASDFNRCVELLRAAPRLRAKLPEMAKLSKEWRRLVAAWDQIEASLVAEVGSNWRKNPAIAATATYKLMKEVLDGPKKRTK